MFNYIGTLNKPTAVSKSITCSFTDPYSKLNVILAKSSYIEIYSVKNENLELCFSHNMFGNIIILEKIVEEKFNKTDNLFILNDSLDFSILKYNKESNEINIIAKGEIREKICNIKNKILYTVDKNYKFILISPYKNIFRVIFLHSSEREKNEDFKINMYYDDILYLFNLNKNFPIKELDKFMEENKGEVNDFEFDYKNMENILNTNSYGYRNLMGVTNRQLFQVIKQNENSLKEEKKTNISYYKNSKLSNSKNNANYSSDLFAIVKISNTYDNSSSNNNLLSGNNNSNSNSERQVITLEPFLIDFQNKELKKIFRMSFEIESLKDSNFMFSPKIGGFVIFYSDQIEYYEILSNKIQKSNSILKNNYLKTPFPIFEDYTAIDLFNYVLYDVEGEMYLFNINVSNKNFSNNIPKSNPNEYEFYLIPLGSLNYISTISYVEKNMFFIGSDKSDSYYVKLNDVYSDRFIKNNILNNELNLKYNKKNLKEIKDYFEILEEFENLAPITNFLVLNDSKDKNNFTDINTEILCVCGVGKYTTLKSIRKGRSYIQDAELPFVLGNNVFSIEASLEANYSNIYHEYTTIQYENNLKIIENYNKRDCLDSNKMIIDDGNGKIYNSEDHRFKSNEKIENNQVLIFIW